MSGLLELLFPVLAVLFFVQAAPSSLVEQAPVVQEPIVQYPVDSPGRCYLNDGAECECGRMALCDFCVCHEGSVCLNHVCVSMVQRPIGLDGVAIMNCSLNMGEECECGRKDLCDYCTCGQGLTCKNHICVAAAQDDSSSSSSSSSSENLDE